MAVKNVSLLYIIMSEIFGIWYFTGSLLLKRCFDNNYTIIDGNITLWFLLFMLLLFNYACSCDINVCSHKFIVDYTMIYRRNLSTNYVVIGVCLPSLWDFADFSIKSSFPYLYLFGHSLQMWCMYPFSAIPGNFLANFLFTNNHVVYHTIFSYHYRCYTLLCF